MAELLTTDEAAAHLRMSERKLYELVAAGAVPCSKATGRWLFPKEALDRWVMAGLIAGQQFVLAAPPAIVGGSHDPLLDWALREADTGLAVAFGGSLDGLRRLGKGEVMLAGTHLADPEAPLGEAWNVTHVRRQLAGQPVVVLEWARRRQGLIVAPDNPLGLGSARDLKRRRVMGRQREAGAFVLLERLLEGADLNVSDIRMHEAPARTEADVAAAVAEGRADAGLGIEAVARQYRLGFVPLVTERYDLVIGRRAAFGEPVQRLLAFGRTGGFSAHAAALGGYDVSRLGTVHYNGP